CGVYASSDAGATWSPQNNGIAMTTGSQQYPPISRIAIAPGSPDTLYLGTFDAANNVGRIYASKDGGSSWRSASGPIAESSGVPVINLPVFDLAIHPRNANSVYAAIEAGVYQTPDGGQNWNRVIAGNAAGTSTSVDNYAAVRIAPSTPDTVYVTGFTSAQAAGAAGAPAGAGSNAAQIVPLPALKSVDAGTSWSPIVNPAPVNANGAVLDALVTDFAISAA